MESKLNEQPLLDDDKTINYNPMASSKEDPKKNKWCCFYVKLPVTGKLKKKTLSFIILILFIDALVNLLLFFTTHHWWFLHGNSITYFTYKDLYNDFTSFHSGTSDTILLWTIRTLSLFILSFIAISKGVPHELWDKTDPNYGFCCCSFCCCYKHKENKITPPSKPVVNYSIQEKSSVVHVNYSHQKKESKSDLEEEYIEIEGIIDKSALHPTFEDKDEEELYRQRKQKCTAIKYGILFLMFILCTVFQGYVGIKCVRFDFTQNIETYQAIYFGVSILCINIEIFLFKRFVESASDLGDRIIIKSVHPHPLKFMRKVNFWCDFCRARTKYGSYRCDGCDFDLCRTCFKKEKKKLLKKQQAKQSKLATSHQSMRSGGNLAQNININAASDSYKYLNTKYNPENDPTLASQKELTSTQYVLRGLLLLKPHWVLITIAFICLFITSITNLLLPRSQGLILDKIINNSESEFVYQVKYYLVLSVIVGLFGSIRNLCFSFISRKLIVSVRSLMFSNIIVQDIDFFDDMSTGELISRMTNDVRGMLTPIRTMLQSTLSNIILLIGGIIMIFLTSWRLSMLAFTTIAPIVFLTQQYAKWSRTINRSIWAAFASSTSVAQQAFSNIRTVRAFGTEKKETRNYDSALQEILERGLINAIATTVTFALTNYMDLIAGVLILWFGGISIFEKDNGNKRNYELTVGKLIAFQLYWNLINNSWKGLQNVITQLTRSAGGAERVLSLLDNISKHNHNLYDGLEPKNGELDGNIFVDNVEFTYKSRPETQILKGIDLNIKPGEVIAFVGRSGGGKTTLINLLMRFYDVDEGDILYNENKLPLNEMNLTVLRHNIGLVAQDTQLFDRTIKENIVYGICDRDVSLDEVIYYSKLANCHEFIDEFEEGYNTRVGERGIKLSGGQKQRIAIARMLIKKPKLLFLDEATSNLDTQSEALVQASIDKTILSKKSNIVILVAHRLSTVINADKIAVIDNGKIVEIGNHNQLLQIENGVYRKLVQRQIQREKNELNQDGDDEKDDEKQDVNKKKKKKKQNVAIDDIDSLFE